MPNPTYDVVVIGSGPGGYVAAVRAAQLGLKTAVVESDEVGGRCLNYACIPAKAVLRSADLLQEVRDAGEFGIQVAEPTVDFDAVMARRAKVIKTLTGGVAGPLQEERHRRPRGPRRRSPPTATSRSAAASTGRRSRPTKGVIVATGSVKKPIPGTQFGGRVIGTEEAWALSELPATMAVVGAGASGTEIAQRVRAPGRRRPALRGPRPRPARPRTPTSPSSPSAASRSRASRSTRRRSSRTSDDRPELHLQVRRRAGRGRLARHRRGPRPRRRGARARRGERQARRPRPRRRRRRAAHVEPEGVRHRRPRGRPGARAQGLRRGHHRRRGDRRPETHPLDYDDIPRATFCTPNVGSLRADRAAGARRRATTSSSARSSTAPSAPAPSTATAPAWSRSSATSATASCWARSIVGARATELIQELVNVRDLEGGYPELARIVHGHPTLSEAVMEAARAADGWLIHG